MQSHVKTDLTDLILIHNVEDICSLLTDWLKLHHDLDVIGFFLKDDRIPQAHSIVKNDPMNVAPKLEELLAGVNQSDKVEQEILFFSNAGGQIEIFGSGNTVELANIIGLAVPLKTRDRVIGNMVVFADENVLQDLMAKPERLGFLPLTSSLLENSLSHESKDNKIRLLNLYQTVSSSLAYVADLQELLTTITGIVTSELFCEESSVLFYDEDTNEFEFFTAFGDTGMELVSTRFPADRGIAGRALKKGKTQVVNDVQNDPDFYGSIDKEHGFQTNSIISAPLISGNEKVGVINAVNKIETDFFTQEDDQILSAIADEVALAIKNARLFDYVVSSYCKIRQGHNSCKGCSRPLKSWTPCVRQLESSGA